MRSYSLGSREDLWLESYSHPGASSLPLEDIESFMSLIQEGSSHPDLGVLKSHFVDKIDTGFLVWKPYVKAYAVETEEAKWERESAPLLNNIDDTISEQHWIQQLSLLWGQESNRANSSADIRGENYQFIKMIAKLFGDKHLDCILPVVNQLCTDNDKFKQRAGVEMLLGYLRGSKHWPVESRSRLMTWVTTNLPKYFELIKPDTRLLWDSFFHLLFLDRDPRRLRPILDWVLCLQIDFKSDSAFSVGKSLSIVTNTVENLNLRFKMRAGEYITLLLGQCDNSFAEIREQIALSVEGLLYIQWQPGYVTAEKLIFACASAEDPLHIKRVFQMDQICRLAEDLPKLRPIRLPPPRVSQSSYDRTSLTLLQWFWNAGHGQFAPTIFPFVTPLIPEILCMTELSDNAELAKYSMAVVFMLPSIRPFPEMLDVVFSSSIQILENSQSWRVRQNTLLFLLVFFYRNLASFSDGSIKRILEVFMDGLKDENLEVRNTAAKVFAGVLRCSQRSQIPELRERFIAQENGVRVPKRTDVDYSEAMLSLHSAILGLCALIDCFPYVVEDWMPPLMEVLARHAADRPPISTTIRRMASDFKKTHQDTWHTDRLAFTEDELQALNTILVGTSYYA